MPKANRMPWTAEEAANETPTEAPMTEVELKTSQPQEESSEPTPARFPKGMGLVSRAVQEGVQHQKTKADKLAERTKVAAGRKVEALDRRDKARVKRGLDPISRLPEDPKERQQVVDEKAAQQELRRLERKHPDESTHNEDPGIARRLEICSWCSSSRPRNLPVAERTCSLCNCGIGKKAGEPHARCPKQQW